MSLAVVGRPRLCSCSYQYEPAGENPDVTANERAARESYVDWLRAVSLLVVVLWHWAFAILR